MDGCDGAVAESRKLDQGLAQTFQLIRARLNNSLHSILKVFWRTSKCSAAASLKANSKFSLRCWSIYLFSLFEKKPKSIFQKKKTTQLDIGYEVAGVIERIVEERQRDVNMVALDNRKSHALVAAKFNISFISTSNFAFRLKTKEISIEAELRQRWEGRRSAWHKYSRPTSCRLGFQEFLQMSVRPSPFSSQRHPLRA